MSNCTGKRKMGKGGKVKYKAGGKLKMVEKNGEQVPFYAADGVGKMAGGGLMQVKKLYKAGGKVDMKTRGCGAATRGMMHSKKMG